MLVIEAVSLLSLNCIKKKLSFPRQSENWRGNLLVFCDFFVYPGDCEPVTSVTGSQLQCFLYLLLNRKS